MKAKGYLGFAIQQDQASHVKSAGGRQRVGMARRLRYVNSRVTGSEIMQKA